MKARSTPSDEVSVESPWRSGWGRSRSIPLASCSNTPTAGLMERTRSATSNNYCKSTTTLKPTQSMGMEELQPQNEAPQGQLWRRSRHRDGSNPFPRRSRWQESQRQPPTSEKVDVTTRHTTNKGNGGPANPKMTTEDNDHSTGSWTALACSTCSRTSKATSNPATP